MENLYLSPDESILLTNQNVVVDGIRHEAVLTGRRLILVQSDDAKAPYREIPLAAIGSAIAGENALREPTITLTLAAPDGVLQTVQLVFIRLSSEHKNNQYDEWVARLKERVKVTIQEPAGAGAAPFPDGLAGERVTPKDLQVPAQQHVPPGMPQVPSYVFRPPKPVAPPKEAAVSKILVAIIVVAVVAIGALVATQFLQAKPAPAPAASDLPQVTPVVTAAPAVTPSPALTAAPAVTAAAASAPQVMIPPSGVWVRVQYPGNYIGFVGTRGSMREVNSTGDRFYQIPAREGVIVADITKMDGSGDLLAVEIYKDRSLIKRVNTTAPHAVLNLNVGL